MKVVKPAIQLSDLEPEGDSPLHSLPNCYTLWQTGGHKIFVNVPHEEMRKSAIEETF